MDYPAPDLSGFPEKSEDFVTKRFSAFKKQAPDVPSTFRNEHPTGTLSVGEDASKTAHEVERPVAMRQDEASTQVQWIGEPGYHPGTARRVFNLPARIRAALRDPDMRQKPVGEPAATAALNFDTPTMAQFIEAGVPVSPLPPKIRA
jgi:hypothetical protein